jgi:hypothetical protein
MSQDSNDFGSMMGLSLGYHFLAISYDSDPQMVTSYDFTSAHSLNLHDNDLHDVQLAFHEETEAIIAALHTSTGGHLLMSQNNNYAEFYYQDLNEELAGLGIMQRAPKQIAVHGSQLWMAGRYGMTTPLDGKFIKLLGIDIDEPEIFTDQGGITNLSDPPAKLVILNQDVAVLALEKPNETFKIGVVTKALFTPGSGNFQATEVTESNGNPIKYLRGLEWSAEESKIYLLHFSNGYDRLMLAPLPVTSSGGTYSVATQVTDAVNITVGGGSSQTSVSMCLLADENQEMSPAVSFVYTGSSTTLPGIPGEDVPDVPADEQNAVIAY